MGDGSTIKENIWIHISFLCSACQTWLSRTRGGQIRHAPPTVDLRRLSNFCCAHPEARGFPFLSFFFPFFFFLFSFLSFSFPFLFLSFPFLSFSFLSFPYLFFLFLHMPTSKNYLHKQELPTGSNMPRARGLANFLGSAAHMTRSYRPVRCKHCKEAAMLPTLQCLKENICIYIIQDVWTWGCMPRGLPWGNPQGTSGRSKGPLRVSRGTLGLPQPRIALFLRINSKSTTPTDPVPFPLARHLESCEVLDH